jgi:hypothetical protein
MLLNEFQGHPRLTSSNLPDFLAIHGDDSRAIQKLGIVLTGNRDCLIHVADSDVSINGVAIDNRGDANEFVFGNVVRPEVLSVQVRVIGSACRVLMPLLPQGILKLSDIFLREGSQTILWGCNSTAVGVAIELAGEGSSMLIGDDCMFSSGIWLRNHDMHTIFDLATDETLNQPQETVTIERHVWFGADACMVRGNIGYGSIVGARSMVTSNVPPTTLVVGTPARIMRTGVCWTREIGEPREIVRTMLRQLAAN